MKKILATICTMAICAALAVGAAAFVDITDENTAEAVYTLESMGLVSGTSATKYSPDLTLTRAQVCTMMVRALGLEKAAESGTASGVSMHDISVAAKTGTAETEGQKDHAWFVAFAPAENPKIALAIVLENSGLTGSDCAWMAKELIRCHLIR